MQTTASWARRAAAGAILVGVFAVGTAAPRADGVPDIALIIARVGERVADYYRRGPSVMLKEKSIVLDIGRDYSTTGFSRVTEYELHIEPAEDGDGSGGTILRELLRINGRVPRPGDRKDRNGCTDSNPVSPEPLGFLLDGNHHEYRFTSAGPGKGKDRGALLVDFSSARESGDGKLIEDPNGHPDCFSFSVPVATRGRLWVDAGSFDVLRLEEHLAGPGEIRVPVDQQRRHNLPDHIVIDRHDTTIRYNRVEFKDPDETLVLPQSIETVIVARNGLQSVHKRQEFSDYRRFLTGGRIIK